MNPNSASSNSGAGQYTMNNYFVGFNGLGYYWTASSSNTLPPGYTAWPSGIYRITVSIFCAFVNSSFMNFTKPVVFVGSKDSSISPATTINNVMFYDTISSAISGATGTSFSKSYIVNSYSSNTLINDGAPSPTTRMPVYPNALVSFVSTGATYWVGRTTASDMEIPLNRLNFVFQNSQTLNLIPNGTALGLFENGGSKPVFFVTARAASTTTLVSLNFNGTVFPDYLNTALGTMILTTFAFSSLGMYVNVEQIG
jgi:hypothetical protein